MVNAIDRNDYYGSALRNRAALLALAAEAGGREGFTQVASLVGERLNANVDHTTTQEQAWLVMAAHAMAGSGGGLVYSVDGERKSATRDPVVINPGQAAIARGVRVKNEGDGTVWMQVTARGVPNEPLPAATQGLSVQREFLTLTAGAPTCGACARTSGYRVDQRPQPRGGYHEVALLDLLPAGFEIETVLTEERLSPSLPAHAHRDARPRGPRRPVLRLVQPRPADLRSWSDSDEELKRASAPTMSPTSCAP